MDKAINDISQRMISRYSDRYRKLGYDVRTLGWGSKEQQAARFEQVIKGGSSLNGKHVLDIGCGFGDFSNFLITKGVVVKHYTGWDLNPDLIAEAQDIWKEAPHISFGVNNIATLGKDQLPIADVGIMLGVLNLNFKDQIDNYEYSKKLITNAFSLVRNCLVVDFLSTHVNEGYPKEDFVFYHDPAIMLEFALTLSRNVELRHNYEPIPQKEFMLFLYK